MSKIIRLTESQLKNIISEIINEQKAPDNKGGFQTYQPPTYKPSDSKPNLGCVAPTDYKIKGKVANSFKYTRPDGEYIFYSNGDVWLYQLNSTKRLKTGKWNCGNNKIEVRWDNDPKAVNYQPLPKDAFRSKLSTSDCAQDLKDIYNGKFLFLGCKGDGVKQMQGMLKIKYPELVDDGNFGGGTKNAVLKFQDELKIKKDGIVGRDVLSFLQKLAPKVPSGPIASKSKPGDLNMYNSQMAGVIPSSK